MPIVKKLRKECQRCGKLFAPTTRWCKTCEPCIKKQQEKRKSCSKVN